MTLVGLPNWEWMTPSDWGWMLALCITGATGHWLLIKCYEVAEASAVQPFAYFQLVFASAIGILLFGETVEANLVLGALIIVSAGLFALWRAHVVAKRGR
jgi:drug/metabolite transporter (DMT)-like permease